jgi:hypothetical protein
MRFCNALLAEGAPGTLGGRFGEPGGARLRGCRPAWRSG